MLLVLLSQLRPSVRDKLIRLGAAAPPPIPRVLFFSSTSSSSLPRARPLLLFATDGVFVLDTHTHDTIAGQAGR